MIEIGATRIVAVRRRQGGKLVPIFSGKDEPLTKVMASEVFRVTRGVLNGSFGRDRNRKLVVGLVAGDLLSLRPQGTRQEVTVALADIYAWVLRSRSQRQQLEKARERKAKLDAQRAERRARAEARRKVNARST